MEYGDRGRRRHRRFKVENRAGKLTSTPAWISRRHGLAEPPVIAQRHHFRLRQRGRHRQRIDAPRPSAPPSAASRSTRAVLYALDAQTGNTCGRAATRSRRGTTGAAFRSPTAGSISAPSTARFIALAIAPQGAHWRSATRKSTLTAALLTTSSLSGLTFWPRAEAAREWTTAQGDAQRCSWVRDRREGLDGEPAEVRRVPVPVEDEAA